MKIIFSKECLDYQEAGQPESPERVRGAYELLKEKGYEFLEPEVANKEAILRAHSKKLFDSVKTNNFYESECPDYKNIFYYASLSAGAAIKAMQVCLKEKKRAFSLMRPPGHHASINSFGGFCYFNNIAIAVKKALDGKIKRAAILDIDFHHGNGTQDIFLNNNGTLFASLHCYPDYPGTGEKSEGNCLNYPLSKKTDEKIYLEKLKDALNHIKSFNPELLAVSAGFDAYKGDPVGGMQLEPESYEKIGRMIKEINKPTFSILEGGYSMKLGECVLNYLKGIDG